jgi:hypothetical protein
LAERDPLPLSSPAIKGKLPSQLTVSPLLGLKLQKQSSTMQPHFTGESRPAHPFFSSIDTAGGTLTTPLFFFRRRRSTRATRRQAIWSSPPRCRAATRRTGQNPSPLPLWLCIAPKCCALVPSFQCSDRPAKSPPMWAIVSFCCHCAGHAARFTVTASL